MSKFIDISEHNTILSLSAIGQSNLAGCIIKATEGTTYIDHACDILYDGINGQLPIGFYHYLTSTSEPETQAQNFWDKIKNKEFQILPILDVEQDSLGDKAQIYSDRFMSEFYQLSGYKMVIYSGRCYIEEHFSAIFRQNNIWWVADYGVNECPTIPNCNIIAWQYTEDEKSYAFCMGDLDVSELIDSDNFYLDNYHSAPTKTPFDTLSIMCLQNELNVQGFKDKNGNSLIVDGFAGELTLSACPIVKTGAQGNITRWIQSKLGASADGIFGEETRQAVIEFQENNSLTGDGIVGQDTWRKLLGM